MYERIRVSMKIITISVLKSHELEVDEGTNHEGGFYSTWGGEIHKYSK